MFVTEGIDMWRLKGYKLTLGTEREGSQLKGWHWTVVTEGLQQQTGCNWRVAAKGFGLRFWEEVLQDFQLLLTEGLELSGCQQMVATDGLQLKCCKRRLGTKGLELRCCNWRLPTESLWLNGWDWRHKQAATEVL